MAQESPTINSTVPASGWVVLLVLAGACKPNVDDGICEGPMCSAASETFEGGWGEDAGQPAEGELCDPVPFQSSDVCGDGIVGEEELCDDANDVDDDGCSNACVSTRGQHVTNFAMDGARAITGIPGPTPEETTIVLGTDPASLIAVDTSGSVLWSTSMGEPGFMIQDVQRTDTNETVVAGASTSDVDFNLWLARIDSQGQIVSITSPDSSRGAPHADTLLRADGSLIVVGFRPIDSGLNDQAGVFAYDIAFARIWDAGLWNLATEPVEPTELSDGTIVVVARRGELFEGTQFRSLGFQLDALDSNGQSLWGKSEICSVDIGARVPGLAALSDDTILVGLDREEGNELLRYDQDTLVSRERWPRYSSYQQIIADDQGGAWLVGDGGSGSYVAYWHPDPARRWIGPTSGTGGVLDAWLEPGRRIWYTTSTGEVFAVSI